MEQYTGKPHVDTEHIVHRIQFIRIGIAESSARSLYNSESILNPTCTGKANVKEDAMCGS